MAHVQHHTPAKKRAPPMAKTPNHPSAPEKKSYTLKSDDVRMGEKVFNTGDKLELTDDEAEGLRELGYDLEAPDAEMG